MNNVFIYSYVFEYCNDGQVHLHGILMIPKDLTYSIMGLLSDICKKVMFSRTIRQIFDCSKSYPQYRRIRQHCVVAQYRESSQEKEQAERVIAFHLYMLKHVEVKR